ADGRAARPQPPLHRRQVLRRGPRPGRGRPDWWRGMNEQKKASIWHRLYHGETAFDFVGRTKVWFAMSALVIAIGVVSLIGQGLNYGIDFKGGTLWEVPAAAHQSDSKIVSDARSAMAALGLGEAKIQVARAGSTKTLRVQFKHQSPEAQTKVTQKLADLEHVTTNKVNKNDVGPSWG